MEGIFTAKTVIFLLLSLLFYIMAYLILKKRAYFLISGFNTRPKDEQEKLIESGSPQATGKLMLLTGILLTMGVILDLLNVPNALEASLAVMLIILFGGFIYIQKYELQKKRKKGYLISGITTAITVIILTVIMISGFSGHDVTISNGQIAISGMYGVEWPVDSIQEVKILDALPDIKMRTNGFSFAGYLKGNFNVEDLGQGKLFIQGNHQPYLLIQTGETYAIINGNDANDVQNWYQMIQDGRASN